MIEVFRNDAYQRPRHIRCDARGPETPVALPSLCASSFATSLTSSSALSTCSSTPPTIQPSSLWRERQANGSRQQVAFGQPPPGLQQAPRGSRVIADAAPREGVALPRPQQAADLVMVAGDRVERRERGTDEKARFFRLFGTGERSGDIEVIRGRPAARRFCLRKGAQSAAGVGGKGRPTRTRSGRRISACRSPLF